MAGVREARSARKPTAIVGLKVRLREPLRKKLELAARKKGVSLNAELVARVEESFLSEGFLESMQKALAEFDKRIARLDDLTAPPAKSGEERIQYRYARMRRRKE